MEVTERTNEQLSAEIAERLFGGLTAQMLPLSGGGTITCFPDYASDHNAALGLVVPEMRKRGWSFEMGDCLDETSVECSFDFIPRTAPFGQEPRAICLAALAALDAEEAQG